MKQKIRDTVMNVMIVIAPVFLILFMLRSQLTTINELADWDLAISIGAMITILIFMMKNKKK